MTHTHSFTYKGADKCICGKTLSQSNWESLQIDELGG